MMIFDRVLDYPSALSDAIGEQYRLDAELSEAFRAGDWVKVRQLEIALDKANRRRCELTPPPVFR
jgi:hypothetical protein